MLQGERTRRGVEGGVGQLQVDIGVIAQPEDQECGQD
jgi:hypothetical protein